MPILEIHLLKGRTADTKKLLVSQLTDTVCRCLEVKPEQVRIIIDEMEYSNFAVGGKPFEEPCSDNG
jgi:4-oxalocrotonate tautomerase